MSERLRNELRTILIRRLIYTKRPVKGWELKVNVRLVEGWEAVVSSDERTRIGVLLQRVAPRPLESLTLREVKQGLAQPLQAVLGLLARLEAIYWEPRVADIGTSRPALRNEPPATPRLLTAQLKARIDEALALPWLAAVRPGDLRFQTDGVETPESWLRRQREAMVAPDTLAPLLDSLLAADLMTARQEFLDIARAAARMPQLGRRSIPRSPPNVDRHIDILLRRYLSAEGAGRTLKELGDELGLTRERARQVCEAFETVFAEYSVAAPGLERVFTVARRLAPTSIAEVNEQLKPYLGEDTGLEALLGWASVLETRACVALERGEFINNTIRGAATMVVDADAPRWIREALRLAYRDCRHMGCSNVPRIAGFLALQVGVAVEQEALEATLAGMDGFRWLDRKLGWFAVGEDILTGAGRRMRKLMAVAEEPLGTDEIAAVFASDNSWMERAETPGLAIPPMHVLRELFAGWSWLSAVQIRRFKAREPIALEQVLSEFELAAFDVIASHQGVACLFELKEEWHRRLGMGSMGRMLLSSPIIERFEHGLYRLRGRRIGNGALELARQRLQIRQQLSKHPQAFADESTHRVTDISLADDRYIMRSALKEQLAGVTEVAMSDEGGRPLGKVRVLPSGYLVGVHEVLRDLVPGSLLRLQLIGDELRVRITPADELDEDDGAFVDDNDIKVDGQLPLVMGLESRR